jgi:putative glutamine amidotransferase
MSAPRIALGAVLRQWDGAERTGLNSAYVRSVLTAGGVPVMLSPLMGPAYAARALDGVDGLVLTGGEDMDPAWYRTEPHAKANPPSRERDLFELAIFAAARQRELPVLGICRGIQVVNVALGGTLWQDLPSERPGAVDHYPETGRSERTHLVRLEPGSLTAGALGGTEVRVNSFHHQAIRDLAPKLVATGWTEDGLIEAVESGPGQPWLLAVQWHPEEMQADLHSPDRGLFRALVERAGSLAALVNSEVSQGAVE